MPYISKWFQQKRAAISLRFDDSSTSHVKTAIPLLNQYGLKGTFMINPGRIEYQKLRKFWEQDLLKMGHDMGNHTWNHRGARTLEEANREIGSVAHLIWKLRPQTSKLMVFASGGGEKWGGKKWSQTTSDYWEIAAKYHLIDLYDGKHPSYQCDSRKNGYVLKELAESAIERGAHQPFHFHEIHQPFITLKGIARAVLNGYDLAFRASDLDFFLCYLSINREVVWIAPIIDILKYESEYNGARLSILSHNRHEILLQLVVSTDAKLFDHPLTLVIPGPQPAWVRQKINGNHHDVHFAANGKLSYADIYPEDSDIHIQYGSD